ncbi:hypothetical protein IWW49_000512 [Coemansia sp. RSA 1797]|nr:hypothetical protein GGH97_000892 [Coemansia sp. RSA 475]KAJ2257761.1 hypothetical protein GGH98_000632 [Coemansia sp. RSA 454]KAJ2593424.1 hypothetical protein IWW49_000512 [Coemansia sp. RSA 1797]
MTTLPLDILCRIIKFAAYSADGSLDSWANMLPYLAISHELRMDAARYIYSRAIIQCTLPPDATFVASTNITLIEQNGFLNTAKLLAINDETNAFRADLVHLIAKALPSKFDALSYTSAIEEIAEDEETRVSVDEEQYDLGYESAESVAQIVARQLPNIKDLGICSTSPHPITLAFLNALMELYGRQLNSLEGAMRANFSKPIYADKLTCLSLFLLRELGDTYFDGIQPNFMPQPLKVVSLGFDMPHSWDMFIRNDDSNTLVFENLKSLQLIGDRFSEYELQDGSIDPIDRAWPKLVVSQLETLVLFEIPIPADVAESLMSAPLKELTYKGRSDYAHMLCQHSTSNLNELVLAFDMYIESNVETFYQNTNAIFRNISKIPIVRCTVADLDLKINWSLIDWSYLTHLYVQNLSDLDKILDAIPAMPYLQFASLIVDINYKTDLSLFVTMLNGLKQRYSKPSSSKLETLLISLLGIDDELDGALDELKWYFPKLEHIGKVE